MKLTPSDVQRQTFSQRFRGLEALILDNLWQDPSMMREALAMKVFRRMGEAAPRESYCRVTLNNQYQGLYALVEEIDPDFAERETGQTNGYLYEFHWKFPFFGEDLGPGLDIYKTMFEPRSHEEVVCRTPRQRDADDGELDEQRAPVGGGPQVVDLRQPLRARRIENLHHMPEPPPLAPQRKLPPGGGACARVQRPPRVRQRG